MPAWGWCLAVGCYGGSPNSQSLCFSWASIGLVESAPAWAHRFLGWFAFLNLVYHFPPLFSAIAVLSTRPEAWGTELANASFLRVMTEGETLAQTAHFLLASVAVTAALQMLLAQQRLKGRALLDGGAPSGSPTTADAAAAERLVIWGARWVLAVTLLQGVVGLTVLLWLPATAQDALLGGDWLGTGLFATAIFGMLGLLHHFSAVAFGDLEPASTRRSVALLLLVIFCMVGARQRGRQLAVAAHQQQAAAATPGQSFPQVSSADLLS